MSYEVRLPVFEGPLDLLLHLLEREEVDIWDIPIVRITEQYLAYLRTMQELDLAVGGEFLVMAATLMQLKARTLLPGTSLIDEYDDDLDPIEELTMRLLEYRAFKEIAGVLGERAQYWNQIRFRPIAQQQLKPKYANPVGNSTVDTLWKCFQQMVADRADLLRVRQVQRREIDLQQTMEKIEGCLAQGPRTFSQMLPPQPTTAELVVHFLAVLELMRLGRLVAQQYGNFTDIHLQLCQVN
ncbi:MAG: segregation/condensation protein A [Firmicutes bacterium]|nr:segregation/condensation protein A [Bacillota bacterium]